MTIRPSSRRGKILMMTGILMPVLIGLLGLTTDIAVLGAGKAQLKTAADSGALAGAAQLASESRLSATTSMSTLTSNAVTQASARGATNSVLGVAATIGSANVSVGYLDPSAGVSTALSTTASSSTFNSVQVTATRAGVPAYFGKIVGGKSKTLTVTSTATVRNRAVTGFQAVNGTGPYLLPIVLSQDSYNAMVARTTVDQYSYSSSTGSVSSGSDGIYEGGLYPIRTGPGNWGTIKIGVSNNSTSTLGSQIRYGITPDQMTNAFPSDGIIKLDSSDTSTSPPTSYHTFDGNPGISAGIKDDLTSIIGRAVTVPIYDQSGGNGNNAWYRIIAFAGIRILAVNFQGSQKYVIVQPAHVTDSTAIADTSGPDLSWSAGGVIKLYISR